MSVHDNYVAPLNSVKEGRRKVTRTLKGDRLIYDFQVRFNQKGDGYRVLVDEVTFPCCIHTGRNVDREWVENKELGSEGKLVIRMNRRRLSGEFIADSGEELVTAANLMGFSFMRGAFGPPGVRTPLLLELPFVPYVFSENVGWGFRDVAVYDFDPKLPKRAVPVSGRRQLEEDGSNLAIVLQRILKDRAVRERFLNLVKFLLPFVEDMTVEEWPGGLSCFGYGSPSPRLPIYPRRSCRMERLRSWR